ncbi:helix-turn-helix domain-containing protein [Gellertiella hungarica]|uniref:DNA-binding transcriptional LysR family regulator n=1 Tax=Gellertiella hungarica TaxID=1572859 RepID=A0A7W6J9D7_9HYPH|nr:LysR family transcriptional regulator [Gellertiella hungarica]MBB4067226.1 DNA-binding transcriptional LysR family regulator [Gellertiella hungarica]
MSSFDNADALLQRGLKLSHLRLLEALSESSQISDAARRLGIAQPAASRLLGEIERIVGRPVHERTGRACC